MNTDKPCPSCGGYTSVYFSDGNVFAICERCNIKMPIAQMNKPLKLDSAITPKGKVHSNEHTT